MESASFVDQLTQSGLTRDQAALYGALLRKGSLPAREAALEAGIGRTLGYALLEQLMEMGLVTKSKEKGSVANFAPAHPSVLQDRIDAQQKSAERAALTLKTILPDLSSLYNLATGRPGVRFYEGLEGIKEVLHDTLTAKESIYTYADLEMIEKHIGDINRDYGRSRDKLNIKKRALLLDTEENRFLLEGYHTKVTDVKLIKADAAPFRTVMQIYDGKISYFTLGVEQLVGVIIADPHIYEMHKILFNAMWNSPLAKPVA
ncbi:MAG: helix-turn-helix domain-containing protein [Minisyncoccia bacterium]